VHSNFINYNVNDYGINDIIVVKMKI